MIMVGRKSSCVFSKDTSPLPYMQATVTLAFCQNDPDGFQPLKTVLGCQECKRHTSGNLRVAYAFSFIYNLLPQFFFQKYFKSSFP